MSQPQDIKIRTLPRGEPKLREKPSAIPRWILYVGPVAALALILPFVLPKFNAYKIPARSTAQVPKTSESAQSPVDTGNVSRHLQESLVKAQMMRSRQRLDNLEMKDPELELDSTILEPENGRSYGVQMDSEDTPERLFKELNQRSNSSAGDSALPDERISARLVNRKWVNEMEREERINFVASFIRSAFDRGYQVEIDQNLVVVGVKKIPPDKKVNIDQVIDRMAKQGL